MTNRAEPHDFSHDGSAPRPRGRGAFLATCVVAGLVYLAIGAATGRVWFGVVGLAIMLGYGAVTTLASRRSETAELLSSSGQDERHAVIQQRAAATTGQVLVLATLAGFAGGMVAGQEQLATTCSALAALGGLTFMAALAWHRRRG